ncbi:MAG TPA: TetR/AcrR family transcriptional regulator [Solirubrobacterales bacterium]|jgi:AcrR family transcriptional regulator
MREEPGARRAGLSREQIGATAVSIADAQGFDDVSMRNVARELDAGTMTLYHYVRNKDELLTLMGDAIMGELVVPDEEFSGEWRNDLSNIARATRHAFKRHPWIFEAMGQPVGSGPNGLRHFDQSMAAVSELRATPRERIELIGLVDDYVFGFTLREVLQEMYEAEGDPDMTESGLAFFESEIASGEYPHVGKMFRGDVRAGVERLMESFTGERAQNRRFERGLKAMLDGFEANLKKPKKR